MPSERVWEMIGGSLDGTRQTGKPNADDELFALTLDDDGVAWVQAYRTDRKHGTAFYERWWRADVQMQPLETVEV